MRRGDAGKGVQAPRFPGKTALPQWLCALKRTLEKDAACLPAMTLRLFSPAHRYSLFKGCFVLAVVLHEHFLDEMVHGLCE